MRVTADAGGDDGAGADMAGDSCALTSAFVEPSAVVGCVEAQAANNPLASTKAEQTLANVLISRFAVSMGMFSALPSALIPSPDREGMSRDEAAQ